MSAALPRALLAHFEQCIIEGLSGRSAAARLKLSAATGVLWLLRLREHGDTSPDPQGQLKGHSKLAPRRTVLEDLIAQDGDITLPELAGALKVATGVVAHSASIGRFLNKLGYTYKKSCWLQSQRLRARKKARHNYFRHHIPAMHAHPDRLVFIYETSVKTNLTRRYGRSLYVSRLEMSTPFGAWGTQTFIAGLTQDNLIATWIIRGAMDGKAFEAYVRNVLASDLQPGNVVICDNLATN